MTRPNPALAAYSDADLRAELAARAAAAEAARASEGKPARRPWYATKEEWARANLANVEATLTKLRDEPLAAGPRRARQQQQIENLEAEARTWRRRANKYREPRI